MRKHVNLQAHEIYGQAHTEVLHEVRFTAQHAYKPPMIWYPKFLKIYIIRSKLAPNQVQAVGGAAISSPHRRSPHRFCSRYTRVECYIT